MLTFVIQSHRGVEQLVARRAHNPEAGGSSPSPATKQAKTSPKTGFCVLFLLSTLVAKGLSDKWFEIMLGQ